MRIAVVVVVVAVGGCGSEPADTFLDVVFDPCAPVELVAAADSSAEERASIDHAIAMWAAVLPTELHQSATDAAPQLAVRFERAAPFYHGVYLDEIGEIVINRALQDDWSRSVTVAHELGHAFGLWHAQDGGPPTVMTEGNTITAPTERDAQAVATLWDTCAQRPR